MKEALKIDESLVALADLPPGWKAWRQSRTTQWHRAKNEEGDKP